jgi:two-component system, NtrC family, sensor kinase
MPKRLALQLILSLTVIVVIVEGVAGILNVKTQERQLLDTMIMGADQLSRGITSATWHAMLVDHREAAYEIMQTIALKQGISQIRIFNKDGRVMFSTAEDEPLQVDKDAEACSLCHASDEPLVRVDVPSRARIFQVPERKRRLAMVTPIYNEPACSDAACHAHPPEVNVLGVLDVALDLDTVDREVADMKFRVFLVTGTQILLVSLLIILFTRRFVSNPIRRLIEDTRAVSNMELDKPIVIKSSEELGELATSFNVMKDRLKEALDEINEFTQGLESKVQERTEQLEEAHQKLLQSNRLASLGQLSASVAHEINNPISGVLNLSMLMQRVLQEDGIPPGRVEEFRRYLSQISSETSRVGRIVCDLLAFSRRSAPRTSPVDFNQVVESTVSLVAHKLKLANVDIELELHKQLPPVICDGSQIQQVVLNLVLNGAEAAQGKRHAKVTVRTRPARRGNRVTLEVKDNGEGIDPELLSKIFDPFFTTKEEGKGVGLGLAVVYGIVEAHQGVVEVSSTVGEGSIFRVRLPISGIESGESDPQGTGGLTT